MLNGDISEGIEIMSIRWTKSVEPQFAIVRPAPTQFLSQQIGGKSPKLEGNRLRKGNTDGAVLLPLFLCRCRTAIRDSTPVGAYQAGVGG